MAGKDVARADKFVRKYGQFRAKTMKMIQL